MKKGKFRGSNPNTKKGPRPVMQLTARQRAFVHEYIKDRNGAQAAIRAGFSPNGSNSQAVRLLANISVKAEIEKLTAKQFNAAELSAEWVLKNLKSVAERCLQAEPVVDRTGVVTGEFKFDSSGANRSLELIGRHLKMFIDRVEQSGPNGGPIQVQNVDLSKLSDEDLQKLESILSKTTQS